MSPRFAASSAIHLGSRPPLLCCFHVHRPCARIWTSATGLQSYRRISSWGRRAWVAPKPTFIVDAPGHLLTLADYRW